MAQKIITTYDGVKYQKITLEEIDNTGHYKEISRTTESVLGLLDDIEKLNETKNNINDFRRMYGTMYILTDSVITGLNAQYYYIFTSLVTLHSKDYDSLGDAIIKTLENIGYVNDVKYNDKEIEFTLTTKLNEEKLTLYLRPILEDMIVVGG